MRAATAAAAAAFALLAAAAPLGAAAQDGGTGAEAAIAVPVAFLVALVLFLLWQSVFIVKQKEVVIIERLGKFNSTLNAGVHFVLPLLDRPKRFSIKYYTSDAYGRTVPHTKWRATRISTQTEVMDFPKQQVITRDNAALYLDAVLSYKIVAPKQCIYSVQNLPNVLSKLLQAQLRSVAGSLEVDQIIEESGLLHVLTGMLDNEARRWGVKVVFVRVQKVEAPGLTDVLAKKKQTDLHNKEVIIGAKAKKQTQVIEAEGKRDAMISKANGQAQEILSRARGDAQATINFANAEARSIKEIARAVVHDGGDPTRYLLATKYLAALADITAKANTNLTWMPTETAFLQTVDELGFNTVLPPGAARATPGAKARAALAHGGGGGGGGVKPLRAGGASDKAKGKGKASW